jgi:PPK2 family polyphosphate:nucleotide phosphotransferase
LNHDSFLVPAGTRVKLKDYSTSRIKPYRDKAEAAEKLQADIDRLCELQVKLYAENCYALLIILQGIDAAGKDGTIKHVMSGVNPMGCQVASFKTPSFEELDHDYLWRSARALPERGNIGIFNRSYYEEVVVVRVHPELLEKQRLPPIKKPKQLWERRFREINGFEEYLVNNGIVVLKFFLNLSKDEQKTRFTARLDAPEKNWKFSEADVKERQYWDDYQEAFEDMLSQTSTDVAPWHIIPADHKWYAHVAVAGVIVRKLESLGLDFPRMTLEQQRALERAKQLLAGEE